MELNLKRPLLFFDIESTGLNIPTDCIVELSFVKVFPEGEKEIKTWRITPWDLISRSYVPMNPSASAVNGINDEDLIDENGKPKCPRFIEVAEEIAAWLKDSDLAGFNSAKFDLPMLAEEFERVKAYCQTRIGDPKVSADKKEKAAEMIKHLDINLHECKMVDVQTIFYTMEPRNLRAAYRFYCGGEDFENAHSAEADTLATYEVLKGQLEMYKEPNEKREPQVLKNDIDYLANLGGRPKTVDFAGTLVYNNEGEVVINFGKHKGKTARQVFNTEASYFAWIQNGQFSMDTKACYARLARQFMEEDKRPLSDEETLDAAASLKAKFGKL